MRHPYLVVTALAAAFTLSACPACEPGTVDAGTPDGGVFPGFDGGDDEDGGTARTDAGNLPTDGGSGPVETTCADGPQATPTEGVCAVTQGVGGLAITGTLLLPGSIIHDGTVVVNDDGTIICSGCDCAQDANGKTAVVCNDAVVSPGLINAHDHMGWMNAEPWVATEHSVDPQLRWEHRHDWRKGRRSNPKITTAGGSASADEKAYGELRFVLSGATSVNGSGNVDGFLRNLDTASGLEGLSQPYVKYQTFPLDDSDGSQHATGCQYGDLDGPQSVDAYTPHVSEGIDAEARNEFLCLTGQGTGASDALLENTAIIHGIGLLPDDIALMASRRVKLIWSPRSNVSLYGNTANVPLMKRLGVEIALGSDWLPSGSMNMLRELRCADELNRDNFGGALSDEDLWRSATLGAAKAMAMDDAIGSLLEDKIADIAVFAKRGREGYRAVIDAEVEDVALVLRGGDVLSGDAAVVAALTANCDVLDVCGTSKRVCAQRELGKSLSALQTAVGTQYQLVPCGIPENEPTCVMSRALSADSVAQSTVYSGARTDDDPDGDGIGADDICPTTFDPARPLDDGEQGDKDGDSVGDSCDPCPLAADQLDCPVFDANDRDNDGRTDLVDNCPEDANPNQTDQDDDLKGDACDPCPMYQNPGTSGCAVLVYDVKTDAALVGQRIAMLDMVVTAVASSGFYAQLSPLSDDYTVAEHSGVFAFTGSDPRPAAGERVNILGATVSEFFNQVQLQNVQFTVVGPDTPIVPEPLSTAELADAIAAGSSSVFEGMLVAVADVVVTNAAPAPGPGDLAPTNEFEVAGGLRVDDGLFLLTPLPLANETFASITGVLTWRNSLLKLLPRDAADLVFGTTTLAGFAPATTYQREGASASTFPTPLTVTLSRATTSDTTVLITSSDGGVASVAGGLVVVPAGALSATVPVVGAAAGTATLTAKLDVADTGRVATVRVLGAAEQPVLTALTPGTVSAAVATTATFTVTLDIPAPAGGVDVTLATIDDAGDVGSVPATVHVDADQTSATFVWTAGAAAANGRVTATLGATMEADVEVVAFVGSLVINEVDYDQPGTDTLEFVEIYNGTNAPAPLAGHRLLLVNGSDNSVYKTIDLAPAGTLAAGQFLVVAAPAVVVPAGALVVRFSVPDNNVQNGDRDGIALVSSTELVDSLSYEGLITAVPLGTPYGTVSLVPAGGGSADLIDTNDDPSPSLARVQDGVDTAKDSEDWMVSTTPTPGAPNLP